MTEPEPLRPVGMSVVPNVDLRPDHWAIVRDALRRHVPDREVLAFGSRATWTAKDYSDLDLAIMGEEPLSLRASSALDEALVESDLPFRVDIVDWARTDDSFRRIIRLHGIVVQGALGSAKASVSVREPSSTSRDSSRHRSWPTVRLGDHADACLGKMLDQKKNRGELFPYLGNKNVRWGRFDISDLGQMRFGDHEHDRYGLKHGDLVVCEGGEPGRCAIWKDEVPGMKIQKALHRIRAREHLDNRFLHYWFLLAGRNGALEPYFTGTTIKHLTGKAIAELQIPLPPKPEQCAIVHVLGTLDDKIELNGRMNETLEAMARALFRSWFVDFDPVRAKMEGRDAGLPDHFSDLFPDRLVDSEMGEIPEGWAVFRLDQLARHHTKSVSPYRSPDLEYEHFSIPAFDAGQRPAVDPGGSIRSNKTVVQEDAVLLSKLNPRIARVWVPAAASGRPQICSTEFLVFTPRPPANRSLLFALFADRRFRDLLKSLVTGTSKSHQRVPPKALKAHEVMAGSAEAFGAFDETMGAVLSHVLKNRSETSTLADLRDTLLPKLISGEIRVLTTDRGPAL